MEQEIVNYIREARKHGLDEAAIKQNLLNAGWDAAVVEESFIYEKAVQAPAAAQAFNPADLVHAQVSQPQPARTTIAAAPGITQTTSMATAPATKMNRGAKAALIIAAVVIVLAGGAYAYYVYGYNSPTRVWAKFLTSGLQAAPQMKSQFNFTYKDSLAAFAQDGAPFNNFTANLSASAYADTSSTTNPTASGSYNVAFTTDSGISFAASADVVLKDNIIYVNVGSSTVLSQYFQKAFPNKPVGWVKIDLEKLKSMATAEGSALPDNQLTNQIKSIWAKANVVGIKNYVGTETVNGVTTMHFENSVDKTALAGAINQTFDAIASFETQKDPNLTIDPASTNIIKSTIDSVVDSVNIESLQTWIGRSDARLYKISASATMPSFLSSIGVQALASARAKSRDATRLADMRQMASALELYFNDFNGYPSADNSGQPQDLTPTYIGVLPTAPEPSDGNCSDYYNAFWYTPGGTKQIVNGHTVYSSYTYTFCLGGDTGGYKAGLVQLSPAGLKDGIACAGTAAQCSASVPPLATSTPATTAEIDFQDTLSDYGKTETVTVPPNAGDIYDLLGVPTSTSTSDSGL
jgi:hypothetical protein